MPINTHANRSVPSSRRYGAKARLTASIDERTPGLDDVAACAARGVYLDPRFLEHSTCVHLRVAMDGCRSDSADILTATFAADPHVRKAFSIDVEAATLEIVGARLDAAREALCRFFRTPLVAREGSDFLRYRTGGFYRPHRDRASVAAWPPAARRRVAVVLFLNDGDARGVAGGFSGGELCLLDAGVTVVPREGCLVAFSASLLHEVAPVERGVRDVVVDWFCD